MKSRPLKDVVRKAATLRGRSKNVADFIVGRLDDLDGLSIEFVAEVVGVSRSTVLRTVQFLGFDTFNDLKAIMKQDVAHPDGSLAMVDHPAAESLPHFPVALNTINCICDAFVEAQEQSEAIKRAARLVAEASLVQVYGAGFSSGVGSLLSAKLVMLGMPSYFSSDPQGIADSFRTLSGGGLLIVVSQMAVNPNILRLLVRAAREDIPSILVTNLNHGPAADAANLVLATGVTEPRIAHDYLPGRIAQIFLLELLAEETASILRDLRSV